MAIVKTVVLKNPIKENKYAQYSQLNRLTTPKFNLDLKMKDRVIIVDGEIVVPFENVSYFIAENDSEKK